jgi:hypothetical protein
MNTSRKSFSISVFYDWCSFADPGCVILDSVTDPGCFNPDSVADPGYFFPDPTSYVKGGVAKLNIPFSCCLRFQE